MMFPALIVPLLVVCQPEPLALIHPLAGGALVGAVAMGTSVAGGVAYSLATTPDEYSTVVEYTLVGAPLATGGFAATLVVVAGGGLGGVAATGAIVAVLDVAGHIAGAFAGFAAAYGVTLGAHALGVELETSSFGEGQVPDIFVPMTLGGAVIGGGVAAGGGTAIAVALANNADGDVE